MSPLLYKGLKKAAHQRTTHQSRATRATCNTKDVQASGWESASSEIPNEKPHNHMRACVCILYTAYIGYSVIIVIV